MKALGKMNHHMMELCELELNNPSWSIAKLSEEFGKPYVTVYGWVKSEVYQEYKEKRLKEKWKDAQAIAQKTIISLAENGDRESAKYILNCMGYEQPKQLEVNTNNIKIVIDD